MQSNQHIHINLFHLLIFIVLFASSCNGMSLSVQNGVQAGWQFYDSPHQIFIFNGIFGPTTVVIDYSNDIPVTEQVTKIRLLELRDTWTKESTLYQTCVYQNFPDGLKYKQWSVLHRSNMDDSNNSHSETFDFPVSASRKLMLTCSTKLTTAFTLSIVAKSNKMIN